jgi:1,4-alpha-glucan branching enzyme
MATEEHRVGTWIEFTQNVLPRVEKLGYDAIQLMAVQEHPYYGSFGYHVSSLFAPSSRFGTPDDLRALISAAHEKGIAVIMDLVHSHAVKNWNEGLGFFDGTDHQYFHAPPRGEHPAWDSLCYDYSKFEVLRLLLSNVRYWLDEFGFDGFRFDGVTSMLYLDHGLGRDFGGYPDYFSQNVDEDALLYLQLANDLAHTVNSNAITIAEDMSGMPGTARPVSEGGLGFDYRLAMGVPDFWIRTVKELPDESWSMGEVWSTLLNRRESERHIGYAESHDQALVGDKTLAFRLMDAAMYSDMAIGRENLAIDRGVALHKLIRLVTYALAGEGYLNFCGNEFGHPEWIDFPREGNGWSYAHARRQWSLVDSPFLRYAGLNAFDAAMQKLEPTGPAHLLALDEAKKLLIFARGRFLFAFNWHPTESYTDLAIPVPEKTDHRRILCTDEVEFAGAGRVTGEAAHIWSGDPPQIRLYLPSRCALVLTPA